MGKITRDEFMAKAIASGKPKDEIKRIYDSIEAAGEFAPDTAQSSTDTTQSPAPGASKNFFLNQDVQYQDGGVLQSFLPRSYDAMQQDKSDPQRYIAAALDVASLPGRAISSLAAGGDALLDNRSFGEAYGNEMKNTSSKLSGVAGFLDNTLKDPATLVTAPFGGPGGAAGKSALVQIGKAVLNGSLMGVTSATAHQANNYAETGKVDLGQAAGEVGASAAMGGAFPAIGKGLGAVKNKAVDAAKLMVSKITDISEDLLNKVANPEELKKIASAMIETGGNVEKMKTDVIEMVGNLRVKAQEEIDKVNNTAQGLTDKVNNTAQMQVESGLLQARPGDPVSGMGDISGVTSGSKIQTAAENAKAGIGGKFAKNQDKVLGINGVGNAPLIPLEKGVHPLQQDAQNILDEIGYTGKYTGNERIGNKAVSEKAINVIKDVKNQVANANTIADALTQRRQLQNKIDFGGADNKPLFAPGSDEEILVKKLYGKFNDTITKQIEGWNPKLASLFNATNKSYAVSRDALESVQNGLRIGKGNADDYFKNVAKIGADELQNLKQLATKDKQIKPVWDEIQSGFYDNVLWKSMKNGELDPATFAREWNKIDPKLKETMLSKEQIARAEGAIKGFTAFKENMGNRIEQQQSEGIKKVAEKYGSSKANDIGAKVIGKTPDEAKTLSSLQNIGAEKGSNQVVYKELKFVEDLAGIPEKDRISTKAMQVYEGKQLGINSRGNVPLITGIRTGKVALGGGLGYFLGDQGEQLGDKTNIPGAGKSLKWVGLAVGVGTQSPAGAIALYRALNKVQSAMDNKVVSGAVKTAVKAASSYPVQQSIRSNAFSKMGD